MTQGPDHTEESDNYLFSTYGEFVLLLDAEPSVLREAIDDCTNDQLHKIIRCLEDQVNETPIDGNEELFKHHLYLWMYCIRQLDEGYANETDSETFKLNFSEWEHNQFY